MRATKVNVARSRSSAGSVTDPHNGTRQRDHARVPPPPPTPLVSPSTHACCPPEPPLVPTGSSPPPLLSAAPVSRAPPGWTPPAAGWDLSGCGRACAQTPETAAPSTPPWMLPAIRMQGRAHISDANPYHKIARNLSSAEMTDDEIRAHNKVGPGGSMG